MLRSKNILHCFIRSPECLIWWEKKAHQRLNTHQCKMFWSWLSIQRTFWVAFHRLIMHLFDGHLKIVPSKPSNVVKFWTRDNTKSKLSHYVVGLFVCCFFFVPKLISFEASKTVVRWVVGNLFVICHSTYLSITAKEREKEYNQKTSWLNMASRMSLKSG